MCELCHRAQPLPVNRSQTKPSAQNCCEYARFNTSQTLSHQMRLEVVSLFINVPVHLAGYQVASNQMIFLGITLHFPQIRCALRSSSASTPHTVSALNQHRSNLVSKLVIRPICINRTILLGCITKNLLPVVQSQLQLKFTPMCTHSD